MEFIEYNEGKQIGEINCYDKYDELIKEKDKLNGKEKVKGYKNGILIYEGEYNGLKNGKGKEYNENGNLIYEGEYYNGKRDGKGKEYNEYGKIIFEGEYLIEKKWNGKEYLYDNMNGKLLYECMYLNGKNLFSA